MGFITTSFLLFLCIPLLATAQTTVVNGTTPPVVTPPGCSATNKGEYCLLEPLPIGTSGTNFAYVDQSTSLASYLNVIFKILLGVIGVLAVIMIIVGGVNYMTTDAIGGKESGKETITMAIGGLILALGSYLILTTINPDLVSLSLNVPPLQPLNGAAADFNLPTDSSIVTSAYATGAVTTANLPAAISCPGKGGSAAVSAIANSFKGNVTYCLYGSDGKACGKGQAGPNNTVQLDCTGFVDEVLACAGLPKTAGMDSGSADNQNLGEPINDIKKVTLTSVNGIDLVPGDVLAWPTTNSSVGHAVIYIGNGQIANSYGNGCTKDKNTGLLGNCTSGGAVGIWGTTDLYMGVGKSASTEKYTQIFRVNH